MEIIFLVVIAVGMDVWSFFPEISFGMPRYTKLLGRRISQARKY